MRVHADFRAFASARFDASQYIPSPSYGVNRFMLDRIGNEKARATTIVEYKPNSKFPEHTHIGGEEFLVLEGTFKDQFGEFPAGTYVRNPIGSKHAPWVDEDGCTIMVKLLQMAEMENETAPLYVNFEAEQETRGVSREYGTALEMYHNKKTGERVEMCWVNPNAALVSDSYAEKGEELFVVDGSLVLEDAAVYPRWGWLRFPAEPRSLLRSSLKAGETGATVYRKTGHLTDEAMALKRSRSQTIHDATAQQQRSKHRKIVTTHILV